MSGEILSKKKDKYGREKKGKTFSMQLSNTLYNRLDDLSKRYGIPKSQLVKDALIEKLNRLDRG